MKLTERKAYGAPQQTFSERFKRSLMNQMAQRLARAHYETSKAELQRKLDNAEMRGLDEALLADWQREIEQTPHWRADACT